MMMMIIKTMIRKTMMMILVVMMMSVEALPRVGSALSALCGEAGLELALSVTLRTKVECLRQEAVRNTFLALFRKLCVIVRPIFTLGAVGGRFKQAPRGGGRLTAESTKAMEF